MRKFCNKLKVEFCGQYIIDEALITMLKKPDKNSFKKLRKLNFISVVC